jgi:NAD+ synthase (glutamine-hydrolysing)
MSKILRIGGACLNQIPMDWDHNLKNIKKVFQEAQENNIELLCLPELCITGYGCEDMFLSTWLCETAQAKLIELLPFTSGLTTCLGLPVRFEGQIYNCIAIIEDEKILGVYDKHNLANDGIHYEKRWFSSWPYDKIETVNIAHQPVQIGAIFLEIKNIKIGFEICEDAWQEDRPANHLATQGIELILNPSASHFAFEKEKYRQQLVISSSKKFNCTYLYTNLLGNEAGRMIYDGDILIAQKGSLIGHNTRFSFKPFNILYCDVDFDGQTSITNLKKDYTGKLEEMSQALPLALFDYLIKSKSKGFVLSLSGGADSSTIAIMVRRMVDLAIKELGIATVRKRLKLPAALKNASEIMASLMVTAYQGTQNSSTETAASARKLAEFIGSTHYEWNIDDQIKGYCDTIEHAIGRKLTWDQDDITLQNIQARSRSPIIWMLANINHSLLLTTSNRSEGDVGYTTMDGDTSGSISPIAAIDKYFILEWLKYAENTLKYSGLQPVNNLVPTAELRPLNKKQEDETDLMPYQVLVEIERWAIQHKYPPTMIYEKMKPQYGTDIKSWIKKFFRLWSINQWKRERLAPSFHMDAFNVDPRTWCRFPILSSGFKEELDELEKI